MSPSIVPHANIIHLTENGNASTGNVALREDIISSLANCDLQEVEDDDGSSIQWTKSIPSVVLYEGKGIDLYEEITRSKHYYLYEEELSIFEKYGIDIASSILSSLNLEKAKHRNAHHNNDRLLLADLGAGRLDKATVLLRSMDKLRRQHYGNDSDQSFPLVTYCAVDIQFNELQDRLVSIVDNNPDLFHHYRDDRREHGIAAVCGVCGSYNAFREYIVGPTPPLSNGVPAAVEAVDKDNLSGDGTSACFQGRKCLMWLGSSFTNLPPLEAADFLRNYVADGMMTRSDRMIIGLDTCQDVEKVKLAYSTENDAWQKYIRNAMDNAGRILGGEAATSMIAGDWSYVSRWDQESGRHVRFAVPDKAVSLSVESVHRDETHHVEIARGEPVLLCQSYKYTSENAEKLFEASGLQVVKEWQSYGNNCSLYLLELR